MGTTSNCFFCVKEGSRPGRIEVLDFMRGAGMLLVLLHHSDIPYGEWILAFHMPFLFFLSGYTMSIHERPQRLGMFLKNRVLRLVVPYFLFEGLNLFVWSMSLILQGGWQDLSEAAIAIITCINTERYTGYYGRLWFWPCLFVSDVIVYFLFKIYPSKIKKEVNLLFSIVGMFFLSWITSNVLTFRLPFAADTAFMATAFLLTGYLLGGLLSWLFRETHVLADLTILTVSAFAMRTGMKSGHAFCAMYINEYGNLWYTLLAAYGGIFSFLILAKWLYALCSRTGFGKDLVLWYGYHSFATFPIHLSIKMWMWNNIPVGYRPWYILLVAMLVVNVLIVNLITNCFPFMLGQFPAKKKQNV